MKKWTPELSVKNDLIDHQHQMLFEIISDLYTNVIERRNEMDKILLRLLVYTTDHFKTEESILTQHYDKIELKNDINNHIKEHKEFASMVIEKIQQYINGESIQVDMAIMLSRWVNDHVIENDVKIFESISNS